MEIEGENQIWVQVLSNLQSTMKVAMVPKESKSFGIIVFYANSWLSLHTIRERRREFVVPKSLNFQKYYRISQDTTGEYDIFKKLEWVQKYIWNEIKYNYIYIYFLYFIYLFFFNSLFLNIIDIYRLIKLALVYRLIVLLNFQHVVKNEKGFWSAILISRLKFFCQIL